jgi:tRNA(Ile2)-agmatinylcytidine synthase
MYEIYIGIDDTDSPEGMCTTYISSVIIDELKDFGYAIAGYPCLIRLNPFARFKTRGNGAVSFKIILDSDSQVANVRNIVLNRVKELSQMENENTNPGVIFYHGELVPELQSFALKAIRSIITIKEAHVLALKVGAEIHQFKKGRGIIGALAAIGCPLDDRTYELLAYRIPENYGKDRLIHSDSVVEMDKKTYPQTFDNLDQGYMAIEPHTPCPILYGIRGESPEAVLDAHNIVKTMEPIQKYCIFQTNQHTDMHIQRIDNISQMEQFGCYIVQGKVKDTPRVIEGGHIFFYLEDDSGEVECAAYEPTKGFRNVIKKLRPGDEVVLFGGIGNHQTLNIEKIEIKKLEPQYEEKNPLCECGKRMKSAGSGKGFKCPKCGAKLRDGSKVLSPVGRDLEPGFYEVPPSARRHLSKQIVRMDKY